MQSSRVLSFQPPYQGVVAQYSKAVVNSIARIRSAGGKTLSKSRGGRRWFGTQPSLDGLGWLVHKSKGKQTDKLPDSDSEISRDRNIGQASWSGRLMKSN